MKFKKLLCIVSIFTVAWVLYSCSTSSQSGEEKEEAGTPVETAEVMRGSITTVYTGSTTLEAEEKAVVVAKAAGIVEKIFVEEGDSVKVNQIMAKLDDEQLKLELFQAKSQLEKLSNEFKINQSLFENKIISRETFEKCKYEHHYQEAAHDLAKLRLDYTEIRAPISGIVSQRFIKVGNMIKMDQPVFSITDFDPLLAVLHVPEKEMSKLQFGLPAEITADALPNAIFQGKILRISPIVDAGTGTIKVTVEVKDKSRRLKPGMFTRVNIVYDEHENTLLVPKDAVLSQDSETMVFVVKKNKVVKREVEIGYENSTHVEIVSGVNIGDIIVTTGLSSLKDGSKISIVVS